MSTSVSRRSAAGHPTRQQLEELDALLKRMLELPVNPLDETADEPPPAPAQAQAAPPAVSAPEPMRGPHHPALTRPPESAPTGPPAVNYRAPETEEADLKPRVVPAAPPEPAAAPPKTEGGDWVPLESSWKPSARTWKPLSDAWQQAKAVPPPAGSEPAPPSAPEPAPRAEVQPTVDPVRPPMPPAPAPQLARRPAPTATPDVTTPWPLWPAVAFNVVFDAFLLPWGPLGRWLRGPTGRSLLGILGLLFLTAAAAWAVAEWIGWTR